MTTQHPSSLWDSERTADYLHVPLRTLDSWAYRGVGPRFFKVGRFRRYHPDDVAAWLIEQARGGGHVGA